MGQESCKEADPGSYSEFSGSISQKYCEEGSFQINSGQSSCDLSEPGNFVAGTGKTEQTECPMGTFQPNYGSANCHLSEPGFYVDDEDRTLQVPCPGGAYSNKSGIGQGGCMAADAGNFSKDGSMQQEKCPPGTFQPYNGQEDCIDSEPGHFVSSSGQKTEIECPSGHFQPNFRGMECQISPENTFSQSGSPNPTDCPDGSKSPAGSSYWSDCFIDSDYDGISDYEDEYPNLRGNGVILSFGYKFLMISVFLVFFSMRMIGGLSDAK